MNTTDRDPLDDLLAGSRPATTPITADVSEEIDRLQVTSKAIAGHRPRVRRWTKPLVAGLASAVLLGGAATAAATTGLWTAPWAHDPVTSFTFTLPSGAVCEQRIGNVTGLEPEEVVAVEEFYRSADFDALLTDEAIAEVIEKRRGWGPGTYRHADGSEEPSGYGTARYSADNEYWTAVWDLVVTTMDAELAEVGIDGIDTDLTFSGEMNCPGAEW